MVLVVIYSETLPSFLFLLKYNSSFITNLKYHPFLRKKSRLILHSAALSPSCHALFKLLAISCALVQVLVNSVLPGL
jgi:hypothetical protein